MSKQKEQYVWLLITTDKYELPLAIADTAVELAGMLGVSPHSVSSYYSKYTTGKQKNCKYRKVKIN